MLLRSFDWNALLFTFIVLDFSFFFFFEKHLGAWCPTACLDLAAKKPGKCYNAARSRDQVRATAFAVVAYRAIRYGELRSMLSVDGSGALEGVADDMVLHAGPCQRFVRRCFDRATLVQLHVVRMDVSVGILDWNFVDDFGARSPTGVCGEFASDVV